MKQHHGLGDDVSNNNDGTQQPSGGPNFDTPSTPSTPSTPQAPASPASPSQVSPSNNVTVNAPATDNTLYYVAGGLAVAGGLWYAWKKKWIK